MTLDMSDKMMQIFLELHSGIPREGRVAGLPAVWDVPL
jgi:hypothetical protein